jgi:hypothetical protein
VVNNSCDMPMHSLFTCRGRASRYALRAWSGWASSVIHGPRHKPDRATTRSQAGYCSIVPCRCGPSGRRTSDWGGDRSVWALLVGPCCGGLAVPGRLGSVWSDPVRLGPGAGGADRDRPLTRIGPGAGGQIVWPIRRRPPAATRAACVQQAVPYHAGGARGVRAGGR